jgi:uncharacterized protein YndB with AHSA1/START domain
MEKTNDLSTMAGSGQVLITRVFNAPRKMVFKAWTDPEHLKHWYAPEGCSIEFFNYDLRPGGGFTSLLKNPAHHDCRCKSVFLEIAAPEKLVFTIAFADEQGNFLSSEQVGVDPEWPSETVVTVTFEEADGKTKVTLHQTVSENIAKRTGAYPSWLQMFDRLGGLLRASG